MLFLTILQIFYFFLFTKRLYTLFVKEVNDICIKLNKFVHKIGFDNYLVILSTAL